MRKVKSRADLNPKAPPAPASAAPAVDPQLAAMFSSMQVMAQNMTAAVNLMAKQAEAKPVPAPVPAAAPSPKRAGLVEALAKAKPAARPAPPAPAAPVPYAGPVKATIERDKKDRIEQVTLDGARTSHCKIGRDQHGRMDDITITCNGQTRRASVVRNRQDKIDTITLHPVKP